MSEALDFARLYHVKLREACEIEDKLQNLDVVKQSEEKLVRLLDDAEMQLQETPCLAGEEFTLADAMFVPVLVGITLLNLEEEYISCRSKIAEYYELVKRRPSYKRKVSDTHENYVLPLYKKYVQKVLEKVGEFGNSSY